MLNKSTDVHANLPYDLCTLTLFKIPLQVLQTEINKLHLFTFLFSESTVVLLFKQKSSYHTEHIKQITDTVDS